MRNQIEASHQFEDIKNDTFFRVFFDIGPVFSSAFFLKSASALMASGLLAKALSREV